MSLLRSLKETYFPHLIKNSQIVGGGSTIWELTVQGEAMRAVGKAASCQWVKEILCGDQARVRWAWRR